MMLLAHPQASGGVEVASGRWATKFLVSSLASVPTGTSICGVMGSRLLIGHQRGQGGAIERISHPLCGPSGSSGAGLTCTLGKSPRPR